MTTESNIALLIDADNASPDHLDEVLLVLGELGTINVRRAYGNWQKTSLRGWGSLSNVHSIVPMQQFDVVKGKSATDMRMTIDAMDLLYRGHVDGFGIMSSDSDFLPLAQRIREDGLPVYGFGTEKTPVSFQNSCTRFIHLGSAAKEPAGSPEPAQAPASSDGVDPALVRLLGDAWKASKRDEQGYASLAEVGQRAKAVSSFSVRNYGFTRLSDLIRSLSDNFHVKGTEGGTPLVRRLR
ncbi:NYN domain-containing protein [Sphingomonas sp. GCM10030256]|uniref:NYN domain-containing protein n=1 Tax=Sphingomonas sp. GCM10030256 TaxID=3273427 RepID=UPI0036221CB0